MADVFVSYASADRPRVQSLVESLRQQGWSVWWDRTILPGKTWDQVLEAELADARCVIVLWSRHSVQSDWVHIEADEAKRRRILVPALIDDVQIPLAFRRIQTANLVDWAEGPPRAGFDELVRAVSEVLSSSSHGEPTHPPTDVVTVAPAADPVPPDGSERFRLPETKTSTGRTTGWGYATWKGMILVSVPILALIGITAYTYTHRASTMASPSKQEPSQFKPEAAEPLSASTPRHPSPPEPSAEPRTNERSKRTSVSPPEDAGPARPPEKLPSLPAGTVRANPKDELSYVWIVAGEFVMGCSPDDDRCRDEELPAHPVRLTRGFWIGQTEVTQAAYRRVMNRNPSVGRRGDRSHR